MLYPRESESRDVKDLSGIWRFRQDREEQGTPEGWYKQPLAGTIPMAVPASFNDLTQDPALREHWGPVWYERDFFVPACWKDRRVVLRVEAACHRGVVYVNGQKLMEHKGGYLPFEAEVNDLVTFGASNRLTITVDSRLDWSTLPPADTHVVRGFTTPEYFHDFFNYAGLHRPVRLYATPKGYIRDIDVVTDLDGADGLVEYAVRTAGDAAVSKVELLDAQGDVVAASEEASGTLRVPEATLWEPGAAYLYTLAVRAGEDVYRLPVGIRTVKVEGTQFLINGKPFYFKGFGKHEDMDVKGKGLDEAMIVKDFNLLRWFGANSFRTSHYPYSEELMNLADEEGFVIIDETNAVGQYRFGLPNGEVFTPEHMATMLPHHLDVVEELIQRDKNHPCVVMWSVGNEPESTDARCKDYFRAVFAKARELDPQHRPVTLVMNSGPGVDHAIEFCDVIAINKYWGWYSRHGELHQIETMGTNELQKFFEKDGPKPVIITEYGADTVAGFHADPPVAFSEEFQVEFLKETHKAFDAHDFVIGEHVWNFADFATKQGVKRVLGNKKGVLTRNRQPKMAAHYMRGRWTAVGWCERPKKEGGA